MKSLRSTDPRKTRLCYICIILFLIMLGLTSRKISWVPDACGDAMWAMMVYGCWRIILVNKLRITAAAAALITSFAVEFSQLLTPDWLVRFRSTFLGHMLLGQGFLWTDLLAYTIGIAVILVIDILISRSIVYDGSNDSI